MIYAKCDGAGCTSAEPLTITLRGGDRFHLPAGWKYRSVRGEGSAVLVACTEACMMTVTDAASDGGAPKMATFPKPTTAPQASPKKDKGKK